jgi:hypothetical protein
MHVLELAGVLLAWSGRIGRRLESIRSDKKKEEEKRLTHLI